MTKYDIIQFASENYEPRKQGAKIVGVIVHCMGLALRESLDILTKAQYNVSSHYFIPRISGEALKSEFPDLFGNVVLQYPEQIPVIQLVADKDRAYHAGVSSFANWNELPGCEKGLNSCTIGIEFHSPGYMAKDDKYKFSNYTDAQKELGIALIEDLMERHHIPATNLLAHSTIAPMRKTDPGPLFFWQELFDNGIGYLPKSIIAGEDTGVVDTRLEPIAGVREGYTGVSDIYGMQAKLKQIGFDCPQSGVVDEQTQYCISAYCLQFASMLWQPEIVGAEEPWNMDAFIASLNSFDAGVFYI
ncbi:MAG: N-acetylmuramoyl-L-alanine amidase [Proteobacteria bacterium]|nr:N-acetylmuramoyl-L-alanine amidase [Pseudomonadota bacterium]